VADWQRVDAFLLRSKRCGYCPPDLPSFGELCKEFDEQFFHQVIVYGNQLISDSVPPQAVASSS
jgi:thiol-disulfide isomerase/thioredoxin